MDRKEFARRRRQFMRMIGKDAIAILPAAPVRHRNGDIEYAYRQDSHFHYLSGFPEPDAVAVLVPGRPQAEYLLFVREHDALRESWDGAWAGTEGAVERYGADDAFPIADIDEILPGLMEQRSQIFYSMGTHLEFDPRMLGWVNGMRVHARQGPREPAGICRVDVMCSTTCACTRAAPSRRACGARRRSPWARIAAPCASPVRGAWSTRSWRSCCMSFARTMPIFPTTPSSAAAPMPASCTIATTISGCATATCCCSMRAASTTTTPRTSRAPFRSAAGSPRRSARSTKWCSRPKSAAIDKVRPGQPLEPAARSRGARDHPGLVKLGLLKGPVAQLIKDQAYLPFFNHRTGHWLGLDVHDVGDYKVGGEWRVLEAGMALTVEPGIYIRPSPRVPKEFWNIGIRIEDDVLVTRGAPEVLTAALEKTPEAIERLVQAA